MTRVATKSRDSDGFDRSSKLEPCAPLIEAGRPLRLGVISNPLSGNNRRGGRLAGIRSIVQRSGTEHAEAETPERIRALTTEMAAAGTRLIVVNGGDGTVQAVLTGLLRSHTTGRLPVLAVLPGGTTNTTARNVGYGERAETAVSEILRDAHAGQLRGRIEPHPTLRVQIGSDPAPFYAMFLGAGAVYHGIRFSKDHVEAHGVRGQLGAGVALAVFLGKIATGQGGSLFPPLEARVAIDGVWGERERLLGVLVSTMERQFLGLRPYWGTESGPLRYSSLAYRPRHLLRAVVPVMRGRPNRFVRPEFGYRSHNAFRVDLCLNSGFTLDGELFTPEAGTELRVSAEQSAYFLRRPSPR
jgi:diacylglycerol kinase (ATP)